MFNKSSFADLCVLWAESLNLFETCQVEGVVIRTDKISLKGLCKLITHMNVKVEVDVKGD